MATKGIIFSAPMVRALLAKTKTQTRRLLAGAPNGPSWYCDPDRSAKSGYRFVAEGGAPSLPCTVPYAPGDRLYVRECIHKCTDPLCYRADMPSLDPEGPWVPSIHMPRRASRLWLAVTRVRVQRLQDISQADAVAEGVDRDAIQHFGTPRQAYAALWNHLHGAENDHSWEANPWIVAVDFEVNRGNIDSAAMGPKA